MDGKWTMAVMSMVIGCGLAGCGPAAQDDGRYEASDAGSTDGSDGHGAADEEGAGSTAGAEAGGHEIREFEAGVESISVDLRSGSPTEVDDDRCFLDVPRPDWDCCRSVFFARLALVEENTSRACQAAAGHEFSAGGATAGVVLYYEDLELGRCDRETVACRDERFEISAAPFHRSGKQARATYYRWNADGEIVVSEDAERGYFRFDESCGVRAILKFPSSDVQKEFTGELPDEWSYAELTCSKDGSTGG